MEIILSVNSRMIDKYRLIFAYIISREQLIEKEITKNYKLSYWYSALGEKHPLQAHVSRLVLYQVGVFWDLIGNL